MVHAASPPRRRSAQRLLGWFVRTTDRKGCGLSLSPSCLQVCTWLVLVPGRRSTFRAARRRLWGFFPGTPTTYQHDAGSRTRPHARRPCAFLRRASDCIDSRRMNSALGEREYKRRPPPAPWPTKRIGGNYSISKAMSPCVVGWVLED